MGELIPFAPRALPVRPLPASGDRAHLGGAAPLAGLALRAALEIEAQSALDHAERMIALLDRMDGDADLEAEPDREDGGDTEPSLAAPEGHESQVGWARGSDRDGEGEAPEPVLPAVNLSAARWGGACNIVCAAVLALAAVPKLAGL